MGLREDVIAFYERGSERQRLSSDRGEMEWIRTRDILTRHLPPSPATIFDIGGGPGAYAFWLAGEGYRVHLIDPVPLHIDQARKQANDTGQHLSEIAEGNALHLALPSEASHVVLLLGPLYHLLERDDHLLALSEAYRVLKPGGSIFAAAISRYASLLNALSSAALGHERFREAVRGDLATGQHLNPTKDVVNFTTAYFHRPADLLQEILESGFKDIRLFSIEGPGWESVHYRDAVTDPEQRSYLLDILRTIEEEPSIIGASAHFLAFAKKPH